MNTNNRPLLWPLYLIAILFLQYLSPVSSFEYQVGGNKGWVVPPENDTGIYNHWASGNRFQVGDTIRFEYKKDSVLEVTKEEYKKCNSTYPSFFSNNGYTIYHLNHSGSFYFISGVSEHCEKGQRMIIKVMLPEDEYSSFQGRKNAAAAAVPLGFALVVVLQVVVVSYVALTCVSYF